MGSHNSYIISADEIISGVWLGNQAASQSAEFIKRRKIQLVINATRDIDSKFKNFGVKYIRVPVDDHNYVGDNPNVDIMKKSLPIVLHFMKEAYEKKIPMLIHCHAGAQRSAAIMAAYLMFSGRAPSLDHAVGMIVKKRPIAFWGGKHVNFRNAIKEIQPESRDQLLIPLLP